MTTHFMAAAAVLLASAVCSPALGAQSIERRVAAAPDGTVRMSFAAREGVCGNGRNVSIHSDRNSDWESDCEPGPIHTVINVSGGKATKVTTYVGGRWRAGTGSVTDLGTVPAREAAAYLVAIAVEIPFMSTTFYTGPLVAHLGGADISWIVGLAVTIPLYYFVARARVSRELPATVAAGGARA